MLILLILILFVALYLMKRWFPNMYGFTKRAGTQTAINTAKALWSRPDKKGCGTIKIPRARWKP